MMNFFTTKIQPIQVGSHIAFKAKFMGKDLALLKKVLENDVTTNH